MTEPIQSLEQAAQTALARYNQTVRAVPVQRDPVMLYKLGEQPRYIHQIDKAGWLANGWSETEPVEEPEPQPEPEPEPPKRASRKKPVDETE